MVHKSRDLDRLPPLGTLWGKKLGKPKVDLEDKDALWASLDRELFVESSIEDLRFDGIRVLDPFA